MTDHDHITKKIKFRKIIGKTFYRRTFFILHRFYWCLILVFGYVFQNSHVL